MDHCVKQHVSGPQQGLPVYEENLYHVKSGGRTTIVARLMVRDSCHGHIFQSEIYQQRFRYRGELQEATTDITLLNAIVTHVRHPILTLDQHAACLEHQGRTAQDFFKLAETCSGLGGLGVGAEFAGWEITVQNDIQEKFTQHQNQFGHVKNVTGSICLFGTLKAMHEADGRSAAMGFGYACQPFSALGDGRQGADERSATLPFGLVASFLLKKELVILECVTNAATSAFVQRSVQHHLNMVKGTKSEVILELGDVWVSKRRRFWTVITKEYMGKVCLQPFPKLPRPPTLGCVFPQFQELATKQLQELTLTDEELNAFMNIGKGIEAQLVDMAGQGGTALHSWGNQIHACACGCRKGLSQSRLHQHGLHGALVKYALPDGNIKFRHLSPVEMGIMNGMLKDNGWLDEQRLLTAGIGQLASPLQSVWVFSQLRNHLSDMGLGGCKPLPAREALAKVMHAVMKQRDEWFPQQPTCAMQMFREEVDSFLIPGSSKLTDSQEDRMINAAAHAAEQAMQSAAHVMETTQSNHDLVREKADSSDKQESSSVAHHHPNHAQAEEAANMTPREEPMEGTESEKTDHGHQEASEAVADNPHASDFVGQDSVVQRDAMDISVAHDHLGRSKEGETPEGDEERCAESFVHHHPGIGDTRLDFVSQGFPGDARTGALNAFMTRPHEVQSSQTESEHEQACSTTQPDAEMDAEMEDIMDTQEETPYISAVAGQPTQTLQCNFTYQELANGGLIMYDADECHVYISKFGNQHIASMLQQAADQMQDNQKQIHTAVGTPMQPDQMVPSTCLAIQGELACHHAATVGKLEEALEGMTRIEALLQQGGAVAVDEMDFYLTSFHAMTMQDKPIQSVASLAVDELADIQGKSQAWLHQIAQQEISVSMILWHHHWIPFVFQVTQKKWIVSTTWEGVMVWDQLAKVDAAVTLEPSEALESQFAYDCGFQAYAWIAGIISNTQAVPTRDQNAADWRRLFWQHLLVHPSNQAVRLGGHGELDTAILAVLREHGVPNQRLHDRLKQVFAAISKEKLAQVFHSSRPWQALKHLANTSQPKLRLVLEDELQMIIKARTGSKQAVASKKQSTPATADRFYVSPGEISVPDAIFCQEGGETLGQIVQKQFGPSTKGVVVVGEKEMQPFLHQGVLSEGGLGFLVIAPYSESIASYGECVRFPAASISTGEPILVSAVLIQKGGKRVLRNTPPQLQAVTQLDTQTIKVLAYRDQVPMDWRDFSAQPVKHMLEWFPILRKCHKERCQCPSWHADQDNTEGPILDLWQRDHLNLHFKRTRVAESQLFVCCVRVPVQVFQQLFQLSGAHGVFFEPRSHDGRAQDGAFQTVWLPKQDLAAAKATQAVLGETSSLVRVNQRYGVKVQSDRARQVHEKLKPEEPFFLGGTKFAYRMGPMPWGCTKKNLQALFTQWGWAAKAIQPCGKAADQSGLMWLIHAMKEPPSLVYTLQHGDVVIHRDDVPGKQDWRPPQAQASVQLRNQYRMPKDLDHDPWAEAAERLPHRAATHVNVTEAHMASLEAKIDQKIEERVRSMKDDTDEPMDSTMAPRIAMLEQQLSQLQANQATMQQQAGTFEQKLDYLNHQVESQAKQFSQTVDAKLSDQLQKIDALLAKRVKTSNE